MGHAGVSPDTKRRINTECKAKVVAAVWGTKFILFLVSYFALGRIEE